MRALARARLRCRSRSITTAASSTRCARSGPTSSSTRCTDRAAKTATSKRCSSGSAFRTRAASSKRRARDGQAPHEETARRRRLADAGLGHVRSHRRHAAAASRFARPAAGRQAALEGSAAGVSIVRTHEAVDESDDRPHPRRRQILAEEFVDGREFTCGVLGEEALPVVEIIATRRVLLLRCQVRARRQRAPRAGADRRRSRRAPANARALGAPAARVARLLAHRLHRERRPPARTFSKSTRCRD